MKRAFIVTLSLAVSVIVFTLLIKASTLLIDIPQDFWKWFSGIIILFFGFITLFPKIWEKIPLLSKLNVGSNKVLASGYQKHTLTGDIIVGASLGPVFSTCSPTYFLVLAAVLPQNFVLGMVYLIAYSVGLSLALLVIAFVGQKIITKAGVAANPHGWFKKVLGIIFIIVGIGIITGADKDLQTKILDSGFFDVTTIEQKLLEFVPSGDDANGGSASGINGGQNGVQNGESEYMLAPEISSPDGFINTDGKPITLEELRGKVVLLDIWTYSCINCRRTLPYLNDWYDKYKDDGLVVVGLHTPEFAFEHVLENVEKATREFGIEYPVVLDNDYSTWNAYGNRYWPRKYLINVDGYIVYDHIGEGAYEETEREIQKALQDRKERMNEDGSIATDVVSPDDVVVRGNANSPEIYFGSRRNEYLANGTRGKSGVQTFDVPELRVKNAVYMDGTWNVTSEYSESQGATSIYFNYDAQNVYMVAGSELGTDISIYKDDKFVQTVTVTDETLYTLISGDTYDGTHELRIDIPSSGFQAFTFTFG